MIHGFASNSQQLNLAEHTQLELSMRTIEQKLIADIWWALMNIFATFSRWCVRPYVHVDVVLVEFSDFVYLYLSILMTKGYNWQWNSNVAISFKDVSIKLRCLAGIYVFFSRLFLLLLFWCNILYSKLFITFMLREELIYSRDR